MSEPRRSTRTRAREEAVQPAPEPPKETPTKAPKAGSKRKRPSTAVTKEPPPATPVPEGTPLPPKQRLPLRVLEGQPLPTLSEPQPLDLSANEWQDIQQSGVLEASLERSRAVWISGVNFRMFHKHFVQPKKVSERTDEDKAKFQRQKELLRNFPVIGLGDKEPVVARLVIEPHTFNIRLFGPREAAKSVPKKPPTQYPSSNYGPWPNHNQQHTQPNQYTYKNAPTYQKPYQQPRPPPQTPSQPPMQAPKSTPAPDPVIHMLAARAGTDPELKSVMKIVANGKATQKQLEYFQSHIEQLTKILAKQKEQGIKPPAASYERPWEKQQPRAPSHISQPAQGQTVSGHAPAPSTPKTAPTSNTTNVTQSSTAPSQPANAPQSSTTPKVPAEPVSSRATPKPNDTAKPSITSSTTSTAGQNALPKPAAPSSTATPTPSAPSVAPNTIAPSTPTPNVASTPVPSASAAPKPSTPSTAPPLPRPVQHHPPPPLSAQQPPRPFQPTPSYPQTQQAPQFTPRPPSYNYNPSPQYRPTQQPVYHPPPRTTYRPLVFEFAEGNNDKLYFPTYCFMEFLPQGSPQKGVKISFLITKMKPKPESAAEPAATVPAPAQPAPPTPATPTVTGFPGAASNAPSATPNADGSSNVAVAPKPAAPVKPYVAPPRIEDFDESKDIADIEFYQPVTALILTDDEDILQSLPRSVRAPDVVERYMNEVFDKCKRADETYLAFRLPKDGDTEPPEKRLKSGDVTPVVTTPMQDVVMSNALDKKRSGRPRKSLT